jgi:hypothetical protein
MKKALKDPKTPNAFNSLIENKSTNFLSFTQVVLIVIFNVSPTYLILLAI